MNDAIRRRNERLHKESLARLEQVAALYASGRSTNSIAAEMGLSQQRVMQLVNKASANGFSVTKRSAKDYKRSRATIECVVCGIIVEGVKSYVDGRQYCSRECAGKDRQKPESPFSRVGAVLLTCDGCGTEFKRSRHLDSVIKTKNTKHTYCSRECYWESLRKNRSDV